MRNRKITALASECHFPKMKDWHRKLLEDCGSFCAKGDWSLDLIHVQL